MTVPAIAVTAPVGPDDAPLVALGPSLGTSTILWENVVPLLAQRYRVVAWDLPGHGAAAVADASFTIGDLADAVVAAVAEPFLYAGISLGGCVGLELLLRHPDLVSAAAIVASGASIGTPDGWHERAAQVRAQSTSSLIIGSAQRWFAPGSIEREPELSGRLLHALQDADDESYALCCEALASFDVHTRLGEIAAPVLAVWGEHDAVAPEASAAALATGIPGAGIARIADAAHLPAAEQPSALAAVLLDFFNDVERSKA